MAAYPKLRVRNNSTNKLPFEQKVTQPGIQGSVAIYPQLRVSKDISDTSDQSPVGQQASVPSSNIGCPTDPQNEKNVPSSSESDKVSQQYPGGCPASTIHVQQQNVSDRPIAVEQDASSASARKLDIVESKGELMESNSSHASETKLNSDMPTIEEDSSVNNAQDQFNEGNRVSGSSSKVMETESHDHRHTSGETLQAMANSDAGHIKTEEPYEPVNEAVSKFGGIVDWKAHRVNSMEKRKIIEIELGSVNEEIQWFREQFEAAEDSKMKVFKGLDGTKRLVDELKLNLERAQIEERQAKQDSELASLRVVEMEQGISDEASFAVKAQFEVAKARHVAALSELLYVKQELKTVRKDYAELVIEKDLTVKKAEEVLSAVKETEKKVEHLTVELITTKDFLESAHAAHLEAEERKLGAAMALEQDILSWEKELKEAEEELEKLEQKILSAKDLKSKLDTASAFLRDMKAELAAYMDSKLNQEIYEHSIVSVVGQEKRTRSDIQAAASLAKKNLEEVTLNIEKATNEIGLLKVAATSLMSQLESEKSALATLRQNKGMASVAVASIEAEVNRTKGEIAVVQVKEREAREKMVELHKQLQKAAEEADQAKLLARTTDEELGKTQEEVEHAKAGANSVQTRLLASQKEIEAAKASEKLAVAAISALQESEAAQTLNNDNDDTPSGVTLTLEEYYKLSKQAHEAEEQANKRVVDALSLVELAKESESRNLSKLENINSELASKKNTLKLAREKAEKAQEAKFGIEKELKKWRPEHKQWRKASESILRAVLPSKSPRASVEVKKETNYFDQAANAAAATDHMRSPKGYEQNSIETDSSSDEKMLKKKKKSAFPRFFMFLNKKKRHPKS